MLRKNFLLFRIIIAILLIQTLYFKFTAHPDSVYIFSQIGLEPFGRIGIGILELITALLILNPKSIWLGSLLSTGIIGGAILMHLTKLGIEINNDGGILFYIALTILTLSVFVLFETRKSIPIIGGKL